MDIRVVTALVIAYKALPENSPIRLRMLQLIPGLDEHCHETSAQIIPFDSGLRQYMIEVFCQDRLGRDNRIHSETMLIRPDSVEDVKIAEADRHRRRYQGQGEAIWVEVTEIQQGEHQ